jgi:Tol biopolymer transport system component
MRLRVTFLLLFVGLHISLGADSKRLLKPDDFAALRDVDEPNLSPGGQIIAYVVGTVDLKKDKQPKNLWLAKWDGSERRALTFGDNEQTHPRWSRAGKWLAFLSGRQD